MENTINTSASESNITGAFFEDLINGIHFDKLTYDTDTMEAEKRTAYNQMMNGETYELAKTITKQTIPVIVKKLFWDYLQLVKPVFNGGLNKIAFKLSGAKIFVWADIQNDREDIEDIFIMAEAQHNALNSEHGFRVFTTIVEESDCLEIPSSFTAISLVKK